MKPIRSLLFIPFFLVFISLCHASEQIVETPLSGQTIITPTDSFGITVTKESEMRTQAGPLFSEGTEIGMELPYLLSSPQPIHYPRWAVHNGWQGKVIVAIEVLTDGSVGRFYLMKSTGHDLLDQAAIKALQSWKFNPALKDGKPVLSCVQIPITFQLRDE